MLVAAGASSRTSGCQQVAVRSQGAGRCAETAVMAAAALVSYVEPSSIECLCDLHLDLSDECSARALTLLFL